MDELITIRGAIGVGLLLSIITAAVVAAVMERLKRKLAAVVAAAVGFALWTPLAALAVTFPDASDEFRAFAVLASAASGAFACLFAFTYDYERRVEAEAKKKDSAEAGGSVDPGVQLGGGK